jgi:hypothetical protein
MVDKNRSTAFGPRHNVIIVDDFMIDVNWWPKMIKSDFKALYRHVYACTETAWIGQIDFHRHVPGSSKLLDFGRL